MEYTPTTILKTVDEGLKKRRSDVYAGVKRNGQWIETSVDDFMEQVKLLALGLHQLGVKKGDKVSIHAENSTEWLIVDLAVLSLGAALVPIYTTQPGDQIKYILENSEAVVHFVSNDDVFAETKPLIKDIENVKAVVSILGSSHKKLRTFEELKQAGAVVENENPSLFEELRSQVEPDDIATLIYTSGTTGVPKGVVLTHDNIAGNAQACFDIFPFRPDEVKDPKILSYLPLAHMFERTASYIYAFAGIPVYYIEEIEQIRDDFQTIRPAYFVTVPRLLEKIVTGIKVKGQELSGLKKQLYYWAVNLAENYDPENPPPSLKYKLADKVVYSKIRELFGGNLIGVNVGGAALSPNIARFMNGIGVYCGLGYGLTETSPVLTGPPVGELRIGSSGKALPFIQLKIAEDGEILAKGPNIMKGYYKMPEKTQEVFDKDGWFCTGDIGHIDEDGWLFVTDRKKSLFKLSTGKYVAPQPIENALVNSGFIEQAVVVGSEHKFCGALIVPNWDNMKKRFETSGHEFPTENLTENEFVLKRIQKEVDKVNEDRSKWEKIKRFTLLKDQFTIEKGEITPTLKVKRNVINKNYKEIIDSMYADEVT